MKKLVVPLAVLLMLGLIGAAVALDCLRLAAEARRPVEVADEDLQKQEMRLVKLLEGYSKVSPEVRTAITARAIAGGEHERHDAYEQIVASFRQTMQSAVDPTNPLDRRFMDDIAGAINRREIARKPYDDELTVYREFLNGTRGRVARWFSSRARADWNSRD